MVRMVEPINDDQTYYLVEISHW